MDSGEVKARGRLGGAFFLVLLIFAAVVIDAWFFGGGFLVSAEWRASRGLFTAGVLVVTLLLWLIVLRGSLQRETARTDEAVEVVRGAYWFVPALIAFVLLFATAAVLLGHTLPKYAHELGDQRLDTVPFLLAAAPGPERRGCHPAKATSPDFGEVTLCLPDRVATALPAGAEPAATVFVSGDRTRFGLSPRLYALQAPDEAATAPDPQPPADDSGFNLNEILEQLGVDSPSPDEPAQQPAPTIERGKEKNR